MTILGGVAFGYLEGHEKGHNVLATIRGIPPPLCPTEPQEPTWDEIATNIGIGAALGLTGGIALCCFGMVVTHHITVVTPPPNRQGRGMESGASGTNKSKVYFKKKDIEDNERSTTKTADKYEQKKKEQEAEAKEILKIGTSGIREKRFGKKTAGTKSSVTKRSK